MNIVQRGIIGGQAALDRYIEAAWEQMTIAAHDSEQLTAEKKRANAFAFLLSTKKLLQTAKPDGLREQPDDMLLAIRELALVGLQHMSGVELLVRQERGE